MTATRLVGRSPRMLALQRAIAAAAQDELPVLLRGESGVGKELAAREIHDRGRGGPFAIQEHGTSVPGQGSVYLVHLNPDVLADVLKRTGGARIIAAVHAGTVPGYAHIIDLPPLRDRLEDLVLIVDALLVRLASRIGRELVLGPNAVETLARHSWPGNVPELARVLESGAIESPDGVIDDSSVRRALLMPATRRAQAVDDEPSVILHDMICISCRRRSASGDPQKQCTSCGVPLFPYDASFAGDLAEAPSFTGRRYLPYRLLSHSAFADVWLSWQPIPGRRAVLKLLASDVEIARARFEREALIQRTLRHPGIPVVYEAGTDDLLPRRHFVAIEYIDGTTLLDFSDHLLGAVAEADRIRRVLKLHIEVLDVLDYLHARGYVHRDVKPTNVLVTPEESAVLIDYGLARPVGDWLTAEGMVIGTAPFMSPEQFRGVHDQIDGRSDLWSVAAMLYLLFTARYPFTGSTFEELFYRTSMSIPEPPRGFNSAIPDAVEGVILKAMSKLPEKRFQRAAEMAEALRRAT